MLDKIRLTTKKSRQRIKEVVDKLSHIPRAQMISFNVDECLWLSLKNWKSNCKVTFVLEGLRFISTWNDARKILSAFEIWVQNKRKMTWCNETNA